ncbi:MAG TPA: RNA 2',3'-cyclic phosphodiesterase [Chloroflexota bacterium]|nr:RNA 2',3'-cyclic phosphodiesterase [Chloroflexota bacterium]
MPDFLRLFIGIDIGDAWTDRLSATADSLRDDLGRAVRWVRPELYHVTVVFVGNQPPESVPSIEAALVRAASTTRPFTLQLLDFRRLGGHEHGALVAGVDDSSGRLQAFRAALDDELRRHNITFDSKRLVPHITLGRPRGRSGPLPLISVDLRDAPPLAVREVDLVKSDLLPTGPVYESLMTVQLGAR